MKGPVLWAGAGVALVLDVLLLSRVNGAGLRPGLASVLVVVLAVAVLVVLRRTLRREREVNAALSARWQETMENIQPGTQ